MTIEELEVGMRVRVPATEKMWWGNHYAYVTDITHGIEGEPLVIIRIPVLGKEKTASPALLEPSRKSKK